MIFRATHMKKIAFFLVLIRCSQAGKHYCPIGRTVNVDMSVRSYQDERLLPRLEHLNDGDRQEATQCSWTIGAKSISTPRQLVLQTLPHSFFDKSQSHNSESTAGFQPQGSFSYRMHFPADFKETCETIWPQQVLIRPGLFRVMPISNSQMYMSVIARLNPQEPETWSRVDLRAVMPQLGFCSRDMLSFQGRCYLLSSAPENATVAISNIKGDAQLAGFSGVDQINEFISANNARLKVNPYKRPLNLSMAVRLGMFYNKSGDRILRVDRREDACQLVEVEGFQQEKYSTVEGQCMSLRTENFDKPVVGLQSCSEPMQSLLSFPENAGFQPGFKCPVDCGKRLLEFMDQLTRTSSQPGAKMQILVSVIVLVLSVITASILVSVALIVARSPACRNLQRARDRDHPREIGNHRRDRYLAVSSHV